MFRAYAQRRPSPIIMYAYFSILHSTWLHAWREVGRELAKVIHTPIWGGFIINEGETKGLVLEF